MNDTANSQGPKSTPAESDSKGGDSMSSRMESLSIKEDAKEHEPEDEEGLPIFPYDRVKVNAEDPADEIDVTKREVSKPNEQRISICWL